MSWNNKKISNIKHDELSQELESYPVGATCLVMKVCKVCGEIKWYTEFPSKGAVRNNRRPYCRACGKRKWKSMRSKKACEKLQEYTGRQSAIIHGTELHFDSNMLAKLPSIIVRAQLPHRNWFEYEVSREKAVRMVEEGAAGVAHETMIQKLYPKHVFRQLILERDHYTCYYCGKYGETVDHIVSKAKGGITSPRNCVCACESCNKGKETMNAEDFSFCVERVTIPEEETLYHPYIENELQGVERLLYQMEKRVLEKRLTPSQTERFQKRLVQIEIALSRLQLHAGSDFIKKG